MSDVAERYARAAVEAAVSSGDKSAVEQLVASKSFNRRTMKSARLDSC
ncbi:MAG: hypothetical protein R3C68_01825 [Myxococcota bacterium]